MQTLRYVTGGRPAPSDDNDEANMYQQLFEPHMEAATDDISDCTPHNQLANETATREREKTTGHCFLFVADIMADYLSYREHSRICGVSLMSSHASKDSSYGRYVPLPQ